MYTLAGLDNTKLGWGRRDETWSFMETLSALGGEDWFRLGDRDLAVHVERTRRLRHGETSLRDHRRLLPPPRRRSARAADDRRSRCARDCGRTRDGSISRTISCAFNAGPWCASLPSTAPRRARAAPGSSGGACATNGCARWSSARPTRSSASSRSSPCQGCVQALSACAAPVVAVSPIIGGRAVKGPTAKMMAELGMTPSAAAVARRYGDLLDGYVMDVADADEAAGSRRR